MQEPLTSRAAGVLLHITSLPGSHYCGDLGPEAHAFIDFLAAAGQTYWQMLPVNPIGDGNSPYSTISSFAGEALLISPELLLEAGLLKRAELTAAGGNGRRVPFAKARRHREKLLRLAADRALGNPLWKGHRDFLAFCTAQASWLSDFALFAALSERYGTADFTVWPVELRERQKQALLTAMTELAPEIAYISFLQYEFHRQWQLLRRHALKQGIALIGDLPIFVSARSADVWAAREFFFLDETGKPTVVAGCPPDAFNADGQLWGNALYDWNALRKDGYEFWLRRVEATLQLFDAVRLDHFIGFYRYWEIKAGARNARGGRWKIAQGDDFFATLRARLNGRLPFIAEDLGAVVQEVRALRDKFELPGMRVVEFAFDGSAEALNHRPYALPPRSAVYTGTHDNHTAKGWYDDIVQRSRSTKKGVKDAAKRELAAVDAYLGTDARRVHWDLIRAALSSPADTCVIPIQDWLGEGAAARMNVPGVAHGNWSYRVSRRALSKELAATMAGMTAAFGRMKQK